MSKTVPVRELRSRLADLLDEVAQRREHVTITRHGRPSAVLVPVDEYAALEETAEILSDEGTLEAIRQGLDDIATIGTSLVGLTIYTLLSMWSRSTSCATTSRAAEAS